MQVCYSDGDILKCVTFLRNIQLNCVLFENCQSCIIVIQSLAVLKDGIARMFLIG